ncbi:MAG: hypothetical protein V7703_00625, partial [Hyphomicrobiales bacterium]
IQQVEYVMPFPTNSGQWQAQPTCGKTLDRFSAPNAAVKGLKQASRQILVISACESLPDWTIGTASLHRSGFALGFLFAVCCRNSNACH